jgi:hypothetical protein
MSDNDLNDQHVKDDETLRAMSLLELIATQGNPDDIRATWPKTWEDLHNSYHALVSLSAVMLRHWSEEMESTPTNVISVLRASTLERMANERS